MSTTAGIDWFPADLQTAAVIPTSPVPGHAVVYFAPQATSVQSSLVGIESTRDHWSTISRSLTTCTRTLVASNVLDEEESSDEEDDCLLHWAVCEMKEKKNS